MQDLVALVDEDQSGQIEFGEFLQIIKGGRAAAKSGQKKTDGTGAIYNFFYNLTLGDKQKS